MTRIDRIVIAGLAVATFTLPAVGMTAAARLTPPAAHGNSRCAEDDVCWNALTMGSHTGYITLGAPFMAESTTR